MSERLSKAGEAFKRQISFIIGQKLNDPVVETVSIKDVDVSPDMKNIRISYIVCVGGPDDSRKVHRHLRKAASFIRRELASEMVLKHVPRLAFVEDRYFEKDQKMEELYREVRKKEGIDAE